MRDGDEVADFRRRRLFALKDGCLLGRVHEAFRAELAREEHQDVVAARERFSRIEAVAAEEFGNLAAQVVGEMGPAYPVPKLMEKADVEDVISGLIDLDV